MKINHSAPADRPDHVNKIAPRRNAPISNAKIKQPAGDEDAAISARDFASVLDDLERTEDFRSDEGVKSDARGDDALDVERDQIAERRDEDRDARDGESKDDSDKGGFDRNTSNAITARHEAPRGDAPGARAIMHIADLERIAALARAQISGGRGEVTLRLHRSVLEGLQINLKVDDAGRIKAELIAASERVRQQVDRRIPELAELLRARNVPLAALKSSVNAETSGGDPSHDGRAHRPLLLDDSLSTRITTYNPLAPESAHDPQDESSFIYRA